MPQKRDVLELFSRDELLAVVDRLGLEVPDRRAKDDLIAAVSASRKATLAEVLPELARDRRKELCRALNLDDSGREKSALVERLSAAKGAQRADATTKNGAFEPKPNGKAQLELSMRSKGKAGAGNSADVVDVVPGDKLTVRMLSNSREFGC